MFFCLRLSRSCCSRTREARRNERDATHDSCELRFAELAAKGRWESANGHATAVGKTTSCALDGVKLTRHRSDCIERAPAGAAL